MHRGDSQFMKAMKIRPEPISDIVLYKRRLRRMRALRNWWRGFALIGWLFVVVLIIATFTTGK